MEKSCIHCRRFFEINRNPNQRYCSNINCQRVRKLKWQKQKLQKDADYQENQQRANQQWQSKQPDYWKQYRAKHTDYTKHNRQQSRLRWKRRHGKKINPSDTENFAKMDVLPPKNHFKTGTYRMAPLDASTFAKMDAFIVKITVIS